MGVRAFSGPGAEDRWRRYLRANPHLTRERILVAARGAERVGMAAVLDLQMAVEGVLVPTDGVAAVAVDPVARQQGVADALVRQAIRFSARKHRAFSALHPFRESFYRRFGYAVFEWEQAVAVPPRTLPASEERVHVRSARPADRAHLARVYRAWRAGRTGPLERSAFWWRVRVLDRGTDEFVYEGARGVIEGYALGSMEDRGPLGRRRYRILEAAWTTPRARRGLLGWLRSLGDELGVVEFFLAPDDPLIAFLRDPALLMPSLEPDGQPAAFQLRAGCMARITDLDRALLVRRGRGVEGTLRVELADPHLPANEKPRHLRLTASGPRLERASRSARLLRAEVGAFTQVLLGAVSATAAREMGRLECDEETARLLDRAWHGPAPFLSPGNRF
jgi:predicted acetyltransferase